MCYRYGIDALSVRYRCAIDTLSILTEIWKFNIDALLMRYHYGINRYQYVIATVSIRYRYVINTLFQRYRYTITKVMK
jgi:hypothetical protein